MILLTHLWYNSRVTVHNKSDNAFYTLIIVIMMIIIILLSIPRDILPLTRNLRGVSKACYFVTVLLTSNAKLISSFDHLKENNVSSP